MVSRVRTLHLTSALFPLANLAGRVFATRDPRVRSRCGGMRDTCPTPAFTSKSRDSVVSLDCGSPWAVDLTADADCNREGVERCHPRLTLGWQRQEVR